MSHKFRVLGEGEKGKRVTDIIQWFRTVEMDILEKGRKVRERMTGSRIRVITYRQ